jgi:hypothetical protein
MDSSRELVFIYAIDFIIILYLIFLIDVKIFDVMESSLHPNKTFAVEKTTISWKCQFAIYVELI